MRNQSFPDKKMLKEMVNIKPVLQQKLKGLVEGEGGGGGRGGGGREGEGKGKKERRKSNNKMA